MATIYLLRKWPPYILYGRNAYSIVDIFNSFARNIILLSCHVFPKKFIGKFIAAKVPFSVISTGIINIYMYNVYLTSAFI